MKIAIVYCSNHGTAEKVAFLIAEKQEGNEVDVVNLLKTPNPAIQQYDRIIIGGSIYFGAIQKQIKRFCDYNEDVLEQKELGLFICCMLDEQRKVQFENAFSEKLRLHSRANSCFGGELQFEKLNFLEKLIVRKVAKTGAADLHIDFTAIDQFVNDLNNKAGNVRTGS